MIGPTYRRKRAVVRRSPMYSRYDIADKTALVSHGSILPIFLEPRRLEALGSQFIRELPNGGAYGEAPMQAAIKLG